MTQSQPLRLVSDASELAPEPVQVAVVIPCFRARETVLEVIAGIGSECHSIYVVDDGCPDGTGRYVESECGDPRVVVVFHQANQGVGAAVMSGYRAALADGASVLVKLDADGQMDPADIPSLVVPILRAEADYTKGNRFYNLTHIRRMPTARLFGNAALSFITKLSSGYWDVFDPTNGLTALHASVARLLPFERIAKRWFFESDLLHHLGLVRAVVMDVPIDARYGTERSNLGVLGAFFSFTLRHARNILRRVFFSYFLHDFSAASVQLALGLPMLIFGTVFGVVHWIDAASTGVGAYSGTVMLAALPVIVGVQMLIAFLSFDVGRVPRDPLHPKLLQRSRVHASIAPAAAGSSNEDP